MVCYYAQIYHQRKRKNVISVKNSVPKENPKNNEQPRLPNYSASTPENRYWIICDRVLLSLMKFLCLEYFTGLSCLISHLVVSSNSSNFHTSVVDFRAISSRISCGSLDMIIGINKLPYCSDVMFNCWIRLLLISSSKVSFTYPTFFVSHDRALWSSYRPPRRLNLSFICPLLMLGAISQTRISFILANSFQSTLTTSRFELDFTCVSTLLFNRTIDQNWQSHSCTNYLVKW